MRNIILILSIFTNVFIIKSQCDYTENNIPSLVVDGKTLCINNDKTVPWGSLTVQDGGVIIINNSSTFTFSGAFTISPGGKIQFMDCSSNLIIPFGTYNGGNSSCEMEVYNCDNAVNPFTLTSGSSNFQDWCKVVPLPVELISFDVKKKDNYIEVNWITGTEINNSHFEILVSNNGTDWESIKIVEGMGNTYDLTYYYEMVQTNKTYFKLKQVDYDGTTSYSNIKYVSVDKQPIFNSTLNYIYISNLHGDVVGFYNIGGQLVHSVNYDGTSVVIKKSNLNTGFYIVRIGELSKKVYIYPN